MSSGLARDLGTRFNKLAIASIVLAVVAAAGMVLGAVPVLAVFSVGAGHVSLQQIKARGEQGAALAYVALGLSYAIGTYALVASVPYFIEVFTATPSDLSDRSSWGHMGHREY